LYSGIDRAVFFLVILSLQPIAFRSLVDFSYCLPVGVVPGVSMSLVSYTRYALVLFPAFLLAGTYLSPPNRRWWLWVLCAFCMSLQMILLIRHVHYYWAG
jgi:hypothetical protein